MKQIIVITLIALGGYFLYTNWENISANVADKVQNEKTIKAVNQGRSQANTEVENVLNQNN